MAMGMDGFFSNYPNLAVAAVPAELLAVCDRIRSRGLKVTPVRAASDLVPLVEADDGILLVADGLRAGGTHYAAIAKPGTHARANPVAARTISGRRIARTLMVRTVRRFVGRCERLCSQLHSLR